MTTRFENGIVVTLGEQNQVLWNGSVVTEGEQIAAVGDAAELRGRFPKLQVQARFRAEHLDRDISFDMLYSCSHF